MGERLELLSKKPFVKIWFLGINGMAEFFLSEMPDLIFNVLYFSSPNCCKSSGIIGFKICNSRGKISYHFLGALHMVSEPRSKHSGLSGLKMTIHILF